MEKRNEGIVNTAVSRGLEKVARGGQTKTQSGG